MRFIPLKTQHEVAASTCKLIIDRINAACPTEDSPFVIALSIGNSMSRTYNRLVEAYERGIVDFSNVVTFNVDSYVGLPERNPESVRSFMNSNFFDMVNIRQDNIHIMNGNAEDLEVEAQRYEDLITAYGGIDLMIGVIGNDGHIAYNEPYSSLSSRCRAKVLAQETIATRVRYFDNDIEKVPKMGLTFGIGTILDCRELVVIGVGLAKAHAVAHAVEGTINHQWSVAACCQMHKNCKVFVDDDAVVELKVKTLRYFRNVMSEYIASYNGITRNTKMTTIMNLEKA